MKEKLQIAMPFSSDDIESLSLVKDGVKNTGVKVTIKKDKSGQLSAMTAGDFYLVRAKEELFAYKPKSDSILYRLHPSARKYWPYSFLNPIAAVLYEGVDDASVLSDIATPVSRLGESAISDLVWLATNKRPKVYDDLLANRVAHIKAFINALVAPKTLRNDLSKWDAVAVRGGDNLGKPGKTATGKSEFIIRFASLDLGEIKFIDPLTAIKEFPCCLKLFKDHKLKVWAQKYIEPVTICMGFEYWNPKIKKYQPIDWKPECQIVVDNTLLDVGKKFYLSQQGRVKIIIPGDKVAKTLNKDLSFVLNLGVKKIDGITFPSTWSSKYATDQYGSPGHFKSFRGFSIGNENYWVTYRVGTRVFLEFRYKDRYIEVMQRAKKTFMASGLPASRFQFLDIPKGAEQQYGKTRQLSQGVLVWLNFLKPGDYIFRRTVDKESWFRTDAQGRIDTVLFEGVKPGAELTVECYMNMQDKGSEFSNVLVYKNTSPDITIHAPLSWKTKITITSTFDGMVSDAGGPMPVTIKGGKDILMVQNALYTLKKIYELHNWLRCLSRTSSAGGSSWKSPALVISLMLNGGTSSQHLGSPQQMWLAVKEKYLITEPKGTLSHTDIALVNPRSIVHEYGHYFVNHLVIETTFRRHDFENKIKYLGHGSHAFRAVTNPYTAFLEGWSAFFSYCFGYRQYFKPVTGESANHGESIEHDIAMVLFEVFQKEVLGVSSPASFKVVADSPNGVVAGSANSYCTSSSYYPNFQSHFLLPIQDLKKDYGAVIAGTQNAFGIEQFCRHLIQRIRRQRWDSSVKKHFVRRNMVTGL